MSAASLRVGCSSHAKTADSTPSKRNRIPLALIAAGLDRSVMGNVLQLAAESVRTVCPCHPQPGCRAAVLAIVADRVTRAAEPRFFGHGDLFRGDRLAINIASALVVL